jgi:hypothetical protein
LSLSIVAAIAVAGGVISWATFPEERKPSLLALPLMFVVGTAVSELVLFAQYYLSYGYRDPKLSVGATVAVWEFLGIAVAGTLAMSLALFIVRCFPRNAV